VTIPFINNAPGEGEAIKHLPQRRRTAQRFDRPAPPGANCWYLLFERVDRVQKQEVELGWPKMMCRVSAGTLGGYKQEKLGTPAVLPN
jgi:hypothetical protein